MNMMQTDIQRAVESVRSGDADKYRIIVERYHVGLIIYCERLLDDRAAAEDVAQQAFINAYDRLEKFDSEKAAFSTWLYRIARNLCLDYLRVQRKHSNYMVDTLPDESLSDNLPYDEAESIRLAVSRLEPPVYGEAVKAYYWQGKSYKEIAHDHRTSVSTVASWIRRAKAELRKELA
jgi:RNA polymerase sigma-70 factor, ECF subfamily